MPTKRFTNASQKPRSTLLGVHTFPRSSKNADTLYDFIRYCEEHPEESFHEAQERFNLSR